MKPTLEELARAVREMMDKQQRYDTSKSVPDWNRQRDSEIKVTRMLNSILDQPQKSERANDGD